MLAVTGEIAWNCEHRGRIGCCPAFVPVNDRTVKPRIPIFVSFSGDGGVERVIANLCRGFLDRGYAVDLLLVKAGGAHMAAIPPEVKLIKLGSSHTLLCLLPLIRYLRRERPAALLAAKNRGNRVAVMARVLAPTRSTGNPR